MFMIDQLEENVGTFPAACQVDPAVSSFFSRSRQSVQPAFARWYSAETPTAPPPMITTRAHANSAIAASRPVRPHYLPKTHPFQFGRISPY